MAKAINYKGYTLSKEKEYIRVTSPHDGKSWTEDTVEEAKRAVDTDIDDLSIGVNEVKEAIERPYRREPRNNSLANLEKAALAIKSKLVAEGLLNKERQVTYRTKRAWSDVYYVTVNIFSTWSDEEPLDKERIEEVVDQVLKELDIEAYWGVEKVRGGLDINLYSNQRVSSSKNESLLALQLNESYKYGEKKMNEGRKKPTHNNIRRIAKAMGWRYPMFIDPATGGFLTSWRYNEAEDGPQDTFINSVKDKSGVDIRIARTGKIFVPLANDEEVYESYEKKLGEGFSKYKKNRINESAGGPITAGVQRDLRRIAEISCQAMREQLKSQKDVDEFYQSSIAPMQEMLEKVYMMGWKDAGGI